MSEPIFVVIPAYNEEEALPGVLDGWYPLVERDPSSRLVVVDDGSTDSTPDVLDRYCAEHPQALAIHKSNGGHGSAIYRGYRFALEHPGLQAPAWVFQTDSDGQTDPGEFGSLWKRREGADAVMGHRNAREDGVSRVVVARVLRLVVALTMHARVLDANVPYRLMRADALGECLALVPESHSLTNVLLSAAFVRLGKRVEFVPITFLARTKGANTIDLKSIVRLGLSALRDFRAFDRALSFASDGR